MSNEAHIHPRLTPDEIVARASNGKINEYYRNVFRQLDRDARHQRWSARVTWGLIVGGGLALAVYEAVTRGL